MQELQPLVTYLVHIITPFNQPQVGGQLYITAMSLGQAISRSIVENNHLPQDTSDSVGIALATAFFSNIVCFGLPKKNYPANDQVVYSSCTISFLYKMLDMFSGTMSTFLANFLSVTMDTVQGTKTNDDFTKAANDFIEFFSIFNYLAQGADLDNASIPSEFGIPKIIDQIRNFGDKLQSCLLEGDKFRAMKQSGQPSDQQEAIFVKSIQDFNDMVGKYHQLFNLLQNKILANFDTLYIEQPYIDWQRYCQKIADVTSTISIISYEVSTFDPSQFTNSIKLIIQLQSYLINSISPYLELLRFRGNFQEGVDKSKDNHEKFGTIFTPLLQVIIGILPKCPPPLMEFAKTKIVSLFQELKTLNEDFNNQVEKLVAAMKADRRFSLFYKVGLNTSQSADTMNSAKGLLDILLKLISQLIKQKSPVNEIAENGKKITEEFNKFNAAITSLINGTTDINKKTYYIQQRDAILYSIQEFIKSFQTFVQNPTNDLLRTQAGLYTTNFFLSIAYLDTSEKIIKSLNSLRPILAENVVQFLPANTKTLIDLLSLINNKASELPQSAREIFLALFPITISAIRESSTIFSQNPDPNNAENVGNCLRESDKLQNFLYVIYQSINVPELPADLKGAAQLLSIFAYNIKYTAEDFRLMIQIYTTHLMRGYYTNLNPLTGYFATQSAALGEQKSKEFLALSESIKSNNKLIEAGCQKLPQFSIFDFFYLKGLKSAYCESSKSFTKIAPMLFELLKLPNLPQEVKDMMNSISAIAKTTPSLLQFIDQLFYNFLLPLSVLIGPILQKSVEETTRDIAQLAEALKSNKPQASLKGRNLVNSLNDLANSMGYDKTLSAFSQQLRDISKGIGTATAHISLGVEDELPSLVNSLQDLSNLTSSIAPLFQSYTQQLADMGREKAAELVKPAEKTDPNVPLFPKGAGVLVDPKGNKYPGLLIDQIPDQTMIDNLFMNAMQSPNDQMKALMTSYVDAIKKDVDEFLPLFAEYQRNPTPELLAKLNALGSRIMSNLKAYQDCLKFKPEEATDDHLRDILSTFQDAPSVSKALLAPELLLNTIANANSKLKDPQQLALLNAAVAEITKNLSENPELAYKQLELLSKALLAEDPVSVVEDCIKKLREDLAKRDAQNAPIDTEALVFADRLLKILTNSPFAPQEGSLQSSMIVTAQQIRDEQKISDEILQAFYNLLDAFEISLAGGDEDENINESEIPDKVLDINNEVMELGVSIQNDLKKSPLNQEDLNKKLNSIKSKSLEVAGLTSLLASKRQGLDKETNEQLQEEVGKVFDSLKSLEEAVKSAGSNARNAQRQVAKANRELTSSLGALSEVIDTVVEKPASFVQASESDYNSYGNILQNQIVKLANFLQNCGEDRSSNKFKLGIKKLTKPLNESLEKFKRSVQSSVHGTDEEKAILQQVSELEKLFNGNLANPEKMDANCPHDGYVLVSDIRNAINDALSTEIVAQPKAVSALPFRYSVPTAPVQATPATNQELLSLIENEGKKTKDNLQAFAATLNNAKSPADTITTSLTSFHQSVSSLINPLDRMIASTWNPQSQNLLSQARTMLISAADYSIDATRNRLLGSDGWREDISSFNGSASSAIEQVIEAARKAFEAAKADLSVTNEAEKELVKAAQSVAESQKRLASMKTVAQEKKISNGEGYLGLDIIDISAPILSTAAKLIETAQAQTRFLLKRDPNLPNTKGLVKTAQDLVESLTLITVAAECTVNNEPDCISKVLAAANLVSSSAAHFLAEVYQKNGSPDLNAAMESITGSIQGLVKQLRAFGEAAQRQESEKNAATAAPSAQKLSAMIQKLNAEAKVVEARRALEEAELKLKKTRQETK